jgi:hypothetical protein
MRAKTHLSRPSKAALVPARQRRCSFACSATIGRARGRHSTTASRTGPAPRSIPFASRVRCLAALGACRRRTALGPGLLAAGPASNFTLLSNVSARANSQSSPRSSWPTRRRPARSAAEPSGCRRAAPVMRHG